MSLKKSFTALVAILILFALGILIRYSKRHAALSLVLNLGGEYLLEHETADSQLVISRHSRKEPLAWDAFGNVYAINLANTTTTNDELAKVTCIHELKHLWIGYTEISDDSVAAIAKFQGLEQLLAEDTQLTQKGIDKIRDSNSELVITLRHAH